MYQLNGKNIPPIAVGTWGWCKGLNGSQMIYGKTPKREDLEKSFDILYTAGFTMWDTSPVYGWSRSEKLLGEFCAKYPDGEKILSTKFSPGDNFQVFEIAGMLNLSKKRFNGENPDIYWLERPKFFDKMMEAFAVLRRENAVGAIGLCNCDVDKLERAKSLLRVHGCKVMGVQNHYSLLHRQDERNGTLNWCKNNNVPYFAYMTLEQGALSGKYSVKNPMPLFSRRGLNFGLIKLAKTAPLIEKLALVGKEYGDLSPRATAILWTKSKGVVPIVGITAPEQAEELVKIKDMEMSQKDFDYLQ